MKKIIISQELDPYFNIAAEHELFLTSDEKIHLFLWQNEASVIIGRNQNLYAECDLEYLRGHNIKAVRRFSGGGAVYHDAGNVNFTFIIKEKSARQEVFIQLIRSAMLKLGIECEFSGRNDLLYKNRKFSGHAFYADGDHYLYHGTILVHVNFEQLGKSLTPSKLKLKSKGIRSVKRRVINLSEINNEITTEKVMEAFMEVFDCRNIEYINKRNFHPPLERHLSSYEWLYAQAPNFDIELERRYPFGIVTVQISISDGLIKCLNIYTDSLQLLDFKTCEEKLIGVRFHEETIWEYIDRFTAILKNHNVSNK